MEKITPILTATSTLEGGCNRVETFVHLQLSKHHCAYCLNFPSKIASFSFKNEK